MVEIPDTDRRYRKDSLFKTDTKPDLLVSVRMPAISYEENLHRVSWSIHEPDLTSSTVLRTSEATSRASSNGLHLKDIIKEVHSALLQEGMRDEVTFMASGGIAMAEHVIKSMLCGANLVAVDVPLLIALECRVCRNCREGGGCPVHISESDSQWGSQTNSQPHRGLAQPVAGNDGRNGYP